jgi:hypothetical protein
VLGRGDVRARWHRPGHATRVRRRHSAPSPTARARDAGEAAARCSFPHGQGARRGQIDGFPHRTTRLKHPAAGPNTTARPEPHLSTSSFPFPLHRRFGGEPRLPSPCAKWWPLLSLASVEAAQCTGTCGISLFHRYDGGCHRDVCCGDRYGKCGVQAMIQASGVDSLSTASLVNGSV